MNIDDIKRHGAMLGLEAEVNVRLATIKSAAAERNWAGARSSAMVLADIAEELRKLSGKDEPCVLTSQEQSSKPSSTDSKV